MVTAFIVPLSLNICGLATAGMEHTLHLAFSLATLWAVVRYVDTGRLPGWLFPCVAILPLMRPEGIALALSVPLVVGLRRELRSALVLATLAVLPLTASVAILYGLGLPVMPNSVVAKLALGAVTTGGPLAQMAENLTGSSGRLLLGLALGSLAALATSSGRAMWPVVVVTALPLLAHLFAGQIGWYNRYEGYSISLGVAGLLLLWLPRMRTAALRAAMPLALVGFVGLIYVPDMLIRAPASARGVYLQQAQMARFAADFVKAPVAVNDLGHVAWRNPNYVLDLFGLANGDVLRTRLGNPPPGWGDAFTRQRGADLAMIYDHWIGSARGPNWVLLGVLAFDGSKGALGGNAVSFYATRPEAAAGLNKLLNEFVPTLPQGARFTFAKADAT